MKKYIADTISWYDDDKLLWGTYVALDTPGKPLIITVWGNTEISSRKKAQAFVELLNRIGNPVNLQPFKN